jgi:dihydrofolate synthase/folylpolyglutamate synthase
LSVPLPASRDLGAWLAYLERLHPNTIELGLDRVARVRDRLGLQFPFPVITVGGTNGKGSTCALLEAMLVRSGYRVGCYTSPHLLRYNERVRVDGRAIEDDLLVRAFERVEAARGEVSLTYFEFGTLAAALVFLEAGLDVAVLEVGLGGRLDAVNVFDADCAVITSLGVDHTEYLGSTRQEIAYEKAGIFRSGRPAVVSEPDMPAAMGEHAARIGARLHLIDRDFGYAAGEPQWEYWSWAMRRHSLPRPALRGEYQLRNAAAALAALDCLRERLPVDMGAIRRGLVEVELAGRFQVLPGRPAVVLDVAHNPQAAQCLAENLGRMGRFERTTAVFAMLKDKDIAGVAREVAAQIDRWLIAPLGGPRGADLRRLASALSEADVGGSVQACVSPADAYEQATAEAGPNDRIVVFGSFYTVADVLARLHGSLST